MYRYGLRKTTSKLIMSDYDGQRYFHFPEDLGTGRRATQICYFS